VVFENRGTSDETNVPVRLLIDPGAYNDPQTIAVLDSGTSYSQAFSQFTPTTGGTYTLTAISELVGDEDPASDTLEMLFTAYDAVLDFEADNGGLAGDGDWEWGTPTVVGPPSAHSGTKCWGTDLDDYRTNGSGTWVYSNLTFQLDVGMDNNATIGFWHWYEASGLNYDSLMVKVNDGSGWTTLMFWYGGPTTDWENVVIDLSAYTGTVDVNFQYGSTSSITNKAGWYIDDLALASCAIVTPDIDVTPLAVSGEADPGFADYDTITVSNTGDGGLNFTATAIMDPEFANVNGQLEQLYAAENAMNVRRIPSEAEISAFETAPVQETREGLKNDIHTVDNISVPNPLPVIDLVIASENFDDGLLPTGWTIQDSGTTADTWMLHSTSTCPRTNPMWSVDWMIVDSDCPGSGVTMVEHLLTRYYDCSANANVHLAFNHYFNNIGSSDTCHVEVRNGSTGAWSLVAGYYSDTEASEDYNITSLIGAGDSVQIKFSYWDNNVWAWYWGVDDFLLYEADTPWLSIDVTSGSIPPAGSPIDIEVTFNAVDVGPGIYTGRIEIASNDPDEGLIEVPATFVVGGTGTVAGQVTDANTAGALEGAIVTATWVSATSVTDTTDASGNYSIDITPGTVNVTVEMPGYTTDSQDVVVVVDQTTTHNVALTAPIVFMDTSPVIDTVTVGGTEVYGRYVYNNGTAPLIYDVTLDFSGGGDPLSIRSNMVSERIASVVDPDGNADAAPYRYNSGQLPVITAFQDSVYCFTLDTLTDTQFLGIEFDGTYFWITGGNSGADPNKLYQYDATGLLVNTYDQTSSAGWGWRDLAWDGTYLYGSDSYDVIQIDPATGMATGVTIAGPSNPARALAYDPDTDHFWTASFSSSIWEFGRDGTVHNTFSNTKAIYGMAWDNLSEDGPWLWVFSQDGVSPDLLEISQFDPDSGTYTGVSWQSDVPTGYNSGMAGGACFTTEFDPSIGAIFVLAQGDPTDFVYGYEIAENVTWLTLQSGGSGEVAVGDSALIEFLVDFTDSAIVIDSTYEADANVNTNDPYPPEWDPQIHFSITAGAGGCDYVVGDVNGSDSYNGLDVTYGVNWFKYNVDPPLCPDCPVGDCNTWYYCGDVNGSCSYNGLDITYNVNWFKYGIDPAVPCPDCPPN
jgi:hypothetical protein